MGQILPPHFPQPPFPNRIHTHSRPIPSPHFRAFTIRLSLLLPAQAGGGSIMGWRVCKEYAVARRDVLCYVLKLYLGWA